MPMIASLRCPMLVLATALLLPACGHLPPQPPGSADRPLATPSPLAFEAPPYDRLRDADYRPAIEAGMRKQRAEIDAIDAERASATFDNTIVALERSGVDLRRAQRVFYNLTSSNTNERLQADKAVLAPLLAAHADAINLDPVLFARIRAVHERRATAGLDAASLRLVERYYTQFVRAGALLDASRKDALKKLNAEESTLSTAFTDHVLSEATARAIVVDRRDELDGASDEEIAAAADAAKARGLAGKWLIRLQNTTTQPVLASLANRALRERIYRASIDRNTSGPNDNRPILTRLAQLRAERARLLGFATWADFVLDDQMAKTPQAAEQLLGGMAPASVRNVRAEAAKLQALIDRQGGGFTLQPWDWDFYAEQVRKAEYDVDEAAIRSYFAFDRVLRDGVFFAAGALYGLSFRERHDLPLYQPDLLVYEVADAAGTVFGLAYVDPYAHDGKNGGAWMSTLVDQSTLLGQQPVIIVNLNLVRPAAGQHALMTYDDVIGLFHEFGHGLHGLLSRQKYPYFSGTSVTADFVEFPSQFNENWAIEPQVFAHYAKHHETGAPMPQALVAKIQRSRRFNQGYLSTEYLAAALLDLEWHSRSADAPRVTDVDAFEQAALAKYGLDLPQVPPRYRTSYFSHIWDGGYDANYYAYLWAEILADDGYQWFVEHGGMTRENGLRYRDTVLSQGGGRDAAQLYRDFRGRDPDAGPLLRKRGLR